MGEDMTEKKAKKERIRQPKTQLVQTGGLTCAYETDPGTGTTHVSISGSVEFDITQSTLSDGTIAFFSGVVESGQFDLKSALERSARNVAVRAANEAWNIANPRTSTRIRMTSGEAAKLIAQSEADRAAREALEAEIAQLRAQMSAPALSVVKTKKNA